MLDITTWDYVFIWRFLKTRFFVRVDFNECSFSLDTQKVMHFDITQSPIASVFSRIFIFEICK